MTKGTLFCLLGASLAATISLGSPAHAAGACSPIRTASDLNRIRNNMDGNFCLTKNIEAGGVANFKPIGDFGNQFTGVLDGRGFTINNLRIHPSSGPAALFISVLGTVKNLGLVNVDVKAIGGDTSAASLVVSLDSFTNTEGTTAGSIENSFSTGVVIHDGSFGQAAGLVAVTNQFTRIIGSYSKAVVTQGTNGFAGGLVGSNAFSATIQTSYATGAVTGGTAAQVGGLVGNGGGTIMKSYAKGRVTVGGGGIAGGFIGVAIGTIKVSYATGPVRGRGGANSAVGGFVGLLGSEGFLAQTYAVGKVSATIEGGRVGGAGRLE